MKKFIGNAVLLVISTYIALFLASFLVAFFFPIKEEIDLDAELKGQRKEKAVNLGLPFDERTRLEVYSDHLAKNESISPGVAFSTVGQAFDIDTTLNSSDFVNYMQEGDAPAKIANDKAAKILPLSGGLSNSKMLIGNENGYFSYRYTDRFGFYNHDSIYNKPHKIMIIGDSFGAGCCVKEEDSFDSYLTEKGFNIINASVSDKAPLSYLATLYEYGEYINPEKVFVLYCSGNDFQGVTLYEMKNEVLRKYFDDMDYRQGLIAKTTQIDTFYKKVIKSVYSDWDRRRKNKDFQFKIMKYSIMGMLTLMPVRTLLKNSLADKTLAKSFTPCEHPNFKKEMINQEQIIIRMKEFTEKKLKADLTVIYLPMYNVFMGKELCYKNPFLDILKKNSINYIDLTEEFSKSKNPLEYFPFELKGHYNEKGYRKLGEVIEYKLNKGM